LWLRDVSRRDIAEVGGKGANLGELISAGIPVPNGFVVTSSAYRQFLKDNNLVPKIKKILSDLDVEKSDILSKKALEIQKLILSGKMSDILVSEIKDAYEALVVRSASKLVAIRSSATAEDLPSASFAGQQKTFLNVTGAEQVVVNVQKAFASLFEARAIYYRSINHFDHFQVALASPVQQMVQADKSGILFTVNPLTSNEDELVIEAGLGLGETIVSGSVNPDQYIIDKASFRIKDQHIAKQAWKMVYDLATGKNVHLNLTVAEQTTQKISNEEILQLARLGLKIENYYRFPQDTEWAIQSGRLFFVQSRPITTLKKSVQPKSDVGIPENTKISSGEPLLKGIPASIGTVTGKVKIIHSPAENNDIQVGDILVAEMTNPSFVPAMKRATAIVTDSGGMTSHAAIVSRELGKPAVVGTGQATHQLKDGEEITVDGTRGYIYRGKIESQTIIDEHIVESQISTPNDISILRDVVPVTGTIVYLNLAEPAGAKEASKLPVDGVGLLRAEFMIAEVGIHPQALIAQKKEEEFVKSLTQGIFDFASAFKPRPVIYRTTDFKTNEYSGLTGGEKFEPKEENPMIGFRGANRYVTNPEVFKLEIEALKRVREKFNLKNVHIMIPFVRTVDELNKTLEIMKENGLERSKDLKIWIMVEVPSTVLLIDKFCQCEIDGVSIGTNDLTQLILGVDRDNEKLSYQYDERDPAVLMAIARVINVCKLYHKTISICGNAASTYPEIVDFMVRHGATSVSVSADVAIQTKKLIASIEKKILLEHQCGA